MLSRFLKFLPHIFILVRCKILRLDVQENSFQIILLIAIEMAVLSVFSKKIGLGPLGVKLVVPQTAIFFAIVPNYYY